MNKLTGQAKVGFVMREFKRGALHSGSKKGPAVTNPKQAIAIALNQAGLSKSMEDFQLHIEFAKAETLPLNDEERMVYGIASLAKDGNNTLVDRQGDMLDEKELVKAAHRFIKSQRVGKVMHNGNPKAEVVESMVLRPDVAKALGLENFNKTAWVIGMKVHDDATWDRVKKGELKAFSIGGRGKRIPVNNIGKSFGMPRMGGMGGMHMPRMGGMGGMHMPRMGGMGRSMGLGGMARGGGMRTGGSLMGRSNLMGRSSMMGRSNLLGGSHMGGGRMSGMRPSRGLSGMSSGMHMGGGMRAPRMGGGMGRSHTMI